MVIETLEGRRLLSGVVATQVGDTVTYQLPDSGAAIHVIETGHVVFAQDSSLNQVGPTFVNVNHLVIAGGAGNDIIHYSGDTVPATITGGAGDDIIVVDSSVILGVAPTCFIDGGDGNDLIAVTQGGVGDTILGGNGDDTLFSGGGVDQFLDGGNGKDTIVAFADLSTATGGNGKDFVAIIGSDDSTLASNGNDVVVTTETTQVQAVITQISAVVDTLPV
jgi:Ca2+-binding RTX toxin-like protein